MSRYGQKNYIRRPDLVERIGSYLGTSFPLFHDVASDGVGWAGHSRRTLQLIYFTGAAQGHTRNKPFVQCHEFSESNFIVHIFVMKS